MVIHPSSYGQSVNFDHFSLIEYFLSSPVIQISWCQIIQGRKMSRKGTNVAQNKRMQAEQNARYARS